MSRIALLLVAATACTSTPRPAAPFVRHGQIFGTGGDGDVSDVQLASRSKVEVDALWVRFVRGGMVGGSSRVVIRTAPNPGDGVRVGMFEQFSGGMGPQWRSTIWVAAVVAATTLGLELTDYEFIAESRGFIEGASAGALLAAAFLASMTGTTVDPKAALTGSIQPDGTIGPVDGIRAKVIAAIKSGKQRVGIPASTSAGSSEVASIRQFAQSRGVTLVELRDVHDAYRLLTGRTLPQATPLARQRMSLPTGVAEQLDRFAISWHASMLGELKISEVENQAPSSNSLARLARAGAVAADSIRRKGNSAAAYRREVRAWAYARSAADVQRLADLLSQGRAAEADALLALRARHDATAITVRAVAALEVVTVQDHLRLTSTIERALSSWGFDTVASSGLTDARKLIAKRGDSWDENLINTLAASVAPALVASAISSAYARMGAEDAAPIATGVPELDCSTHEARRAAASYLSAAGANLRYFESLVLADIARELDVSPGAVRAAAISRDPQYVVALLAFNVPQAGDSVPRQLADVLAANATANHLHELAGGILSYIKTSLLIAEASLPKHQRAQALDGLIRAAERKAREHAHAALSVVGAVPIQALRSYQEARALQDGNGSDRLQALEWYWRSSVYSSVGTLMASHAKRSSAARIF